jgi:hypothetical protein
MSTLDFGRYVTSWYGNFGGLGAAPSFGLRVALFLGANAVPSSSIVAFFCGPSMIALARSEASASAVSRSVVATNSDARAFRSASRHRSDCVFSFESFSFAATWPPSGIAGSGMGRTRTRRTLPCAHWRRCFRLMRDVLHSRITMRGMHGFCGVVPHSRGDWIRTSDIVLPKHAQLTRLCDSS